jgi:hypothetical protein
MGEAISKDASGKSILSSMVEASFFSAKIRSYAIVNHIAPPDQLPIASRKTPPRTQTSAGHRNAPRRDHGVDAEEGRLFEACPICELNACGHSPVGTAEFSTVG